MTEFLEEELTTEHDIYISIGLKNPMKSSELTEIIETILVENIYMESWGTHTKNEYIEIMNEACEKTKVLTTTIQQLKEENYKYRSSLEEYKSTLEGGTFYSRMKLDLDRLRQENERLKDEQKHFILLLTGESKNSMIKE